MTGARYRYLLHWMPFLLTSVCVCVCVPIPPPHLASTYLPSSMLCPPTFKNPFVSLSFPNGYMRPPLYERTPPLSLSSCHFRCELRLTYSLSPWHAGRERGAERLGEEVVLTHYYTSSSSPLGLYCQWGGEAALRCQPARHSLSISSHSF